MKEIIETMLANGYAQVPFAGLEKMLTRAYAGMNELMAIDEEEKPRWSFELEDDIKNGLLKRGGKHDIVDNMNHDEKYYFHWRPCVPSLLDSRQVDCTQHQPWFNDLQMLHNACSILFEQLARELSPHLTRLDKEPEFDHANNPIRVLYYHKKQKELVAQPHFDKNLLTIVLGDDLPGLELLGKVIHHKKNHCLVFPSLQTEYLSQGKITAALHRSIATPEWDQYKKRMAVIYFGNLKRQPGMPPWVPVDFLKRRQTEAMNTKNMTS